MNSEVHFSCIPDQFSQASKWHLRWKLRKSEARRWLWWHWWYWYVLLSNSFPKGKSRMRLKLECTYIILQLITKPFPGRDPVPQTVCLAVTQILCFQSTTQSWGKALPNLQPCSRKWEGRLAQTKTSRKSTALCISCWTSILQRYSRRTKNNCTSCYIWVLLRFHNLGYKISLGQSLAMTLDKRKNVLRPLDVSGISCHSVWDGLGLSQPLRFPGAVDVTPHLWSW